MNVWRSKLSSWRQRHPSGGLRCAVMRHTQRADSSWPPDPWTHSRDAELWPFDPPVTEAGRDQARVAAVTELCGGACRGEPGTDSTYPQEDSASGIISPASPSSHTSTSNGSWVVVSSPYFRCVQTAVEVCLALGPGSVLLVDNELGEVYGPEIMGETEPMRATRPHSEIVRYCQNHKVTLRHHVVGRWPLWPEGLVQARGRLLSRFLKYLRRGSKVRKDFVLVTHADGVAASLAAMPTINGRTIEEVSYGGMFIAEASLGALPEGQSKIGRVAVHDDSEAEDETGAQGAWVQVDSICSKTWSSETSNEEVLPDKKRLSVTNGFRVRCCGVRMGHRYVRNFSERLRSLSRRTGYSESDIARLLRCRLPQQAFFDGPTSAWASRTAHGPGDAEDSNTHAMRCGSPDGSCSWSTIVFGASPEASFAPTLRSPSPEHTNSGSGTGSNPPSVVPSGSRRSSGCSISFTEPDQPAATSHAFAEAARRFQSDSATVAGIGATDISPGTVTGSHPVHSVSANSHCARPLNATSSSRVFSNSDGCTIVHSVSQVSAKRTKKKATTCLNIDVEDAEGSRTRDVGAKPPEESRKTVFSPVRCSSLLQRRNERCRTFPTLLESPQRDVVAADAKDLQTLQDSLSLSR